MRQAETNGEATHYETQDTQAEGGEKVNKDDLGTDVETEVCT